MTPEQFEEWKRNQSLVKPIDWNSFLKQINKPLDPIVAPRMPSPEVIEEFRKHSNIDWDFDEPEEVRLIDISEDMLNRMADTLVFAYVMEGGDDPHTYKAKLRETVLNKRKEENGKKNIP